MMFGYIDEWAEASYAAPVLIEEVSGSHLLSTHWKFVTQYLAERESNWGYWAINGDQAGTAPLNQIGLMSSDWLSVN